MKKDIKYGIDNKKYLLVFAFSSMMILSCNKNEYEVPKNLEIQSFKGYSCYFWRGTICVAKLDKITNSNYCNPVFVFYSGNQIDSIKTDHFDETKPEYNCNYDINFVEKLSKKFLEINKKVGITSIWYDTDLIKYHYTYDIYNRLPEIIIPLNEDIKLRYRKNDNYDEIKEKGFFLIKP